MQRSFKIGLIFLLALLVLAPAGQAAYVDNGDTITDTVSGLEWQKATAPGIYTWQEVLAYCEGLTLGNHSDWRLPDRNELRSLVDYSRYNPAIDPIFAASTQSSYYWSSTTSAGYTNYAWVVSFDYGYVHYGYKSGSYYVRAVRGGQSGALGSSGYFAFAPIGSPVTPNTCFPVRVEARSASGVVDTSVNGNVSLGVNYGGVSPNTLSFSNGVASDNCVKVLSAGRDMSLYAQGFGRSGESGLFNSSGSCAGKVTLVVQKDVTAILYNAGGAEVGRQTAVKDPQHEIYSAVFPSVPCGGNYRARIERGAAYKDDTRFDVTAKGVIKHISLAKQGADGTPVILIPGIMGSSRPTNKFAPLMEGPYPDRGLEFHWSFWTGWDGMQNYLEANGFTVLRCPWDWRNDSQTSMKRSVAEFLMPVINESLRYSSTGKVHIVAHSLGGLLAREYIQGSLYRNDVANLALVGVPNLGSANPYFLWEAGDIYTSAKVFDDNDSFDGLYGNTVQRLWEKTYGIKNWKKCNTKAICEFVQDVSPSLRQLLLTEKMLKRNGAEVPVIAAGHENVWLKNLNAGAGDYNAPGEMFNKDGSGGKVKSRVFVGNQVASTLRFIEVGSNYWSYPDGTVNYPDGIPLDVGPLSCSDEEMMKKATNTHVQRGNGDTTVPYESSFYPVTAGWADREENISGQDHAKLMKDFRGEIVGFLKGTRGGVTSEPVAVPAARLAGVKGAEAVAEDTQLAFSVIGDAALLVTDNQGRRSGVTPDTHEVVSEIPDAALAMDDMVTTLTLTNAAAGQYQLTYYGLSEQELTVDIAASNSAGEVQTESFEGFKPAAPQTMTVVYDTAAPDFLLVQPVLAAPQEFEAEPYTCGADKCVRLKWKASTGAGVTRIVVYRALVNTPFYAEHTRLPATTLTYDTGEPWDTVNEIPINAYAVSAIKANEVESFFAEDKEGECVFPWTMFLPAITHGRQRP